MVVSLSIDTADKRRGAEIFQALTMVAVEHARKQLRERRLPSLYKSGVRYKRQPPGTQCLLSPLAVLKRKGGDCKQLVVWRMAELLNAGEQVTPRIVWIRDKSGLTAHAQIRRADNSIEDPSVELGMKL